MYYWAMSLIFFLSGCELLTVLKHGWPVVTLIFDFLGQSVSAIMVSSSTRVHILHDVDGFFSAKAAEKGPISTPSELVALELYIIHALSF